MKSEATMADPTDPPTNPAAVVEQVDRDAAAQTAVLVEMRDLIRDGRADGHAEPWSHHREAAFQRGVKAGLEAAAGAMSTAHIGDEGAAIARIDPATIKDTGHD